MMEVPDFYLFGFTNCRFMSLVFSNMFHFWLYGYRNCRYIQKGKFSELFEKIYGSVIQSVQNIEEYEKHGTLAESLTHYLFTEM